MNKDFLNGFLQPIDLIEISEDEGFKHTQIGSIVKTFEGDDIPDIETADLIILGCGEYRGQGDSFNSYHTANKIRKEFYSLYYWHKNIQIIDLGNIQTGIKIKDSVAAIETVLAEITKQGRKVILLGGSHDIAQAQSNAFRKKERLHEFVNIDAKIDIDKESPVLSDYFLLKLFTQSPNFIKQYNHIGFQSYFVHPHMLETIDKLRFDCYRLGIVKEDIEEMEPLFRNSEMVTVDISAFANSFAPANLLSPNGFTGEEMCTLFKYMGMSNKIESIGIYGYEYEMDQNDLTAKQLSHCIWYLIDGIYKGKQEAHFDDESNFNEYHLMFSEVQTTFLQSKKTGRWWMKLPNGKFTACSYKDYELASQNEVPERWIRAIERE